jgi:hypothetical protein
MRHCVLSPPTQAERVIVISEKVQEVEISNDSHIVSTLFVVVRVIRIYNDNSFTLLFDFIVNDIWHLAKLNICIGLALGILNIYDNGMFILFIDIDLEIAKEHIKFIMQSLAEREPVIYLCHFSAVPSLVFPVDSHQNAESSECIAIHTDIISAI